MGPAAKILANDIPIFRGGGIGAGGIRLPDRVRDNVFIGLILLLQDFFCRLVRAGRRYCNRPKQWKLHAEGERGGYACQSGHSKL